MKFEGLLLVGMFGKIDFTILLLPYSRKFSEGLIFGNFGNLVQFPKINFRKLLCKYSKD